MVTTNPAKCLGIDDRKGRIAEGYDADIVVADKPEELHIEKVYAKGKQLVDAGKTIWPGYYVKDPYYDQYH
jgi:N-acetylglucosamine-6-phosphate deacetylase